MIAIVRMISDFDCEYIRIDCRYLNVENEVINYNFFSAFSEKNSSELWSNNKKFGMCILTHQSPN